MKLSERKWPQDLKGSSLRRVRRIALGKQKAGFNVQIKGKHHKCGQYWHKSDSPKGPENQETDGNKNPSRGDSKSGLNVSRRSKTRCQNFLFIRDLIVLKVKM